MKKYKYFGIFLLVTGVVLLLVLYLMGSSAHTNYLTDKFRGYYPADEAKLLVPSEESAHLLLTIAKPHITKRWIEKEKALRDGITLPYITEDLNFDRNLELVVNRIWPYTTLFIEELLSSSLAEHREEAIHFMVVCNLLQRYEPVLCRMAIKDPDYTCRVEAALQTAESCDESLLSLLTELSVIPGHENRGLFLSYVLLYRICNVALVDFLTEKKDFLTGYFNYPNSYTKWYFKSVMPKEAVPDKENIEEFLNHIAEWWKESRLYVVEHIKFESQPVQEKVNGEEESEENHDNALSRLDNYRPVCAGMKYQKYLLYDSQAAAARTELNPKTGLPATQEESANRTSMYNRIIKLGPDK